MSHLAQLEKIANKIRLQIIESSYAAKTQHIGSCLSCVDLLTAAYFYSFHVNTKEINRDRILFSKGHAALALYSALYEKKILSKNNLDAFNKPESMLAEHPSLNLSLGIEISSGSLGHGLSLGLGIAAGLAIQKIASNTLVLMSDGECNEGSVWEAAILAPKVASKLIAVIDYNKWQATGKSNEITELFSLKKKWEAFGWMSIEIDGHNMKEIIDAYSYAKKLETPIAIVAHTIKGKGVSFMENDNNWHYRKLSLEEYTLAKKELSYEKCFC